MAVDQQPQSTWNYKYAFFCSLVVIAALVVWIVLLLTHCKGPTCTLAAGPGDAPHTVLQIAREITALDAHSITVSWQSPATFATATSTYVIDANTAVFREVPKDAATVTRENSDFQKRLLASRSPLLPPPSYTLVPAKFSDLHVGMSVSIETTVSATPGTPSSAPTASRILIVPDAPVSTATSPK